MTQLVHACIPLLQTIAHAVDLLHVQDLGLHPVDAGDLGHLVDFAFEQSEGESLHDQMLDLFGFHLRFGRDGIESQVAAMRRSTEDHLCQSREGDLLVEEDPMLLQKLVLADVPGQHIVRGQVAAVE